MGEVFKLNHCYNMDCLPAMELFPDNYFDLAVVDPPYFSGPERRGFYGSKVSKIGVHRDYPVSPAWSKPEPEYFKELFRVCRHYIVWGCNYFDYQFSTGRIVWDKCNGNSSFSDCEIAATNLFSSVRMFRYMWSGMMQGKSITEGDTMQGNKSLNEKRMIDFSSTVVELSGDSEKQKEVQDIAKCLRTLYSTPIGSQEGDRELGINPNIFVDKPLPVAKGLYVAEVTEKTASFEPRARVVRVDWLDSDVLHGVVIPKVVYELV